MVSQGNTETVDIVHLFNFELNLQLALGSKLKLLLAVRNTSQGQVYV